MNMFTNIVCASVYAALQVYHIVWQKKLSSANTMKTQLQIIHLPQKFFEKINFVHHPSILQKISFIFAQKPLLRAKCCAECIMKIFFATLQTCSTCYSCSLLVSLFRRCFVVREYCVMSHMHTIMMWMWGEWSQTIFEFSLKMVLKFHQNISIIPTKI